MKNIYQEHNCADREAYLKMLSKQYGVDFLVVGVLATALGPNEDFDGLISELEAINSASETSPYDEYLDDDFYDRCLG